MVKEFLSAKEMLNYILEGNDLYNPNTEEYVFVYNDNRAICVYSGIDDIFAEDLKRGIDAGEGEHWSELLSIGGFVFDEEPGVYSNLNWCEDRYTEEGWMNASDYLKDIEVKER